MNSHINVILMDRPVKTFREPAREIEVGYEAGIVVVNYGTAAVRNTFTVA